MDGLVLTDVLVASLCVVAERVLDDVAVVTVILELPDELVAALCVVAALVLDDVAADTVVLVLPDVLVAVLCVVDVNASCTRVMMFSAPLLAAAASPCVKGYSVTMMEPRANTMGIVAKPATPDSLRLIRILTSSSSRSVEAKSSFSNTICIGSTVVVAVVGVVTVVCVVVVVVADVTVVCVVTVVVVTVVVVTVVTVVTVVAVVVVGGGSVTLNEQLG